VDFVTGSTRFGSLSSNTHTFTGSLAITGSGPHTVLGQVVIGTTASAGVPLEVYSATASRINLRNSNNMWAALLDDTTNSLYIRHGTTSNNILNISSSGNIGMGTTNPTSPLHIVRYVGSSGALLIEGNSSSTGNPSISLLNSATGGTGTIGIASNNGGIHLNSVLYVTGSSSTTLGTGGVVKVIANLGWWGRNNSYLRFINSLPTNKLYKRITSCFL
jgi:hypothetical protein